jgi:ribosomal protein S26
MKKQFKLNCAVGTTANIVRLRAHVIRVLKKPYRAKSRLGRVLAHRRADYRYRPASSLR